MSVHKQQNHSVHRKDSVPGPCVCVFPSTCAHTGTCTISGAGAGQKSSLGSVGLSDGSKGNS